MNRQIDFKGLPMKPELKKLGKVGPYYHRDIMEILFIVEGKAVVEYDGKTEIIEGNDFVIINAGMFHTVSGDCIAIPLFVDMKYFEKRIPHIRGISFQFKTDETVPARKGYADIIRAYFIKLLILENFDVPERNFIITGVAENMMKILCEHFVNNEYLKEPFEDMKLSEKERLYSMICFIYNNYKEHIDVACVAAAANLSKSRAAHFFTDKLNVTLQQTIVMNRVLEMARLLTESKKSIGELSDECGFLNEKALYRDFRGIFGITPNEFRQRHYHLKYINEDDLSFKEYFDLLSGYCETYFTVPRLDFIEDEDKRKTEENLFILLGMTLKERTRNRVRPHNNREFGKLSMELHKGLSMRDGRYVINFEYVYVVIFLLSALNMAIKITLDAGVMPLERWDELVGQLLQWILDRCGQETYDSLAFVIRSYNVDELELSEELAAGPTFSGVTYEVQHMLML